MARQKVLVIAGPTASGKSELAVRLAQKYGGEVVSADSRQVYKGLDAGTGKISKKEMQGIPHHLLDVADPKKQFSASDFKKLAEEALQDIIARGKLPVVAGGTGFYIDALAGTVGFPDVPPSKLLRSKLNKLSKEKLFEMLKKKDPRRAREIDQNNKVRLIRALEITEALGKVPRVDLAGRHGYSYSFVFIGIKPDKEKLNNRILVRLLKRLPYMIRESKHLHEKDLSYRRISELGFEYKYLSLYLQNKITKQELVNGILRESKNYAKRQMTWFKRNRKIKWFAPSGVEGFRPDEYKKIEKYLDSRL